MCSGARSGWARPTNDESGAAMKDQQQAGERDWGTKLLWLVGLWAASVRLRLRSSSS